jgi:hypothetical protein
MKYKWTFRRESFIACPKRTQDNGQLPHEAIQEFIILGKNSIETAMMPFQYGCKYCGIPMPSDGKWQVTVDAFPVVELAENKTAQPKPPKEPGP